MDQSVPLPSSAAAAPISNTEAGSQLAEPGAPHFEVIESSVEAIESSFEAIESGLRTFYTSVGKRCLDVLLVTLAVPLWLVLYLVIAAMVLVFQGRPIHFVSERVGRNGQTLRIVKFRTMSVNANSDLAALLAADPALDEEFRAAMKLQSDPRVTPIGRFLRRLSLDELPQLLNVLAGHMSLVGPRPVLQSELEEYYGDAAGELVAFRPGLTGIWQISGRSLLSYDRRVQLDLQYVRDCGFWTDLAVLVRTVPCVLRGYGAC
jgi:exopolysaccharide production protein ExoY